MGEKMYVSAVCNGCGAPLPQNMVCEYCWTRHIFNEKKTRLDTVPQSNFECFSSSSTCSVTMYRAYPNDFQWRFNG